MVAEQRTPSRTDTTLNQLVADHTLLIRPGDYPAVLVAVDVVDADDDGDRDFMGWFRPSQFWSFRLDLGHGRTVLVDRPYSADDAMLLDWGSALLGCATSVPPNEEERAELVGRACTVAVRLQRRGTGSGGQRRPIRLELPDLDCRLDVPDDDPWLVWESEIVEVAPRPDIR